MRLPSMSVLRVEDFTKAFPGHWCMVFCYSANNRRGGLCCSLYGQFHPLPFMKGENDIGTNLLVEPEDSALVNLARVFRNVCLWLSGLLKMLVDLSLVAET